MAMVRVGCVQDGVGYSGLGDTEALLSQKHTVGDKGNESLTSLSPHHFCGILDSVL